MKLNRMQIRRLVESVLNESPKLGDQYSYEGKPMDDHLVKAAAMFDLSKAKFKRIPLENPEINTATGLPEVVMGTVSQRQYVVDDEMVYPNAIVKNTILGPSDYLFICSKGKFSANIANTYGVSDGTSPEESKSIDDIVYLEMQEDMIYNLRPARGFFLDDHFSDNNKFDQMVLIELPHGKPTSAGNIPLEIRIPGARGGDPGVEPVPVRRLFKIGIFDAGSY